MTKIAHIVWGLETGGIETMLIGMVNEQIKSAHISIIVINDMVNPSLVAKINPAVDVIYLSRRVGSKNPLPIIKLNYTLLSLHPTTIHCHSYSIVNYLLPTLRKRAILTIHTTLKRGLTKKVLTKYRCVCSISRSVHKMLIDNFGIESKIIYNGIDFSAINSRTTFDSPSVVQFIQTGRLIAEKGHKTALRALAQISTPWHLDIIGSGQILEELEEEVRELNISDNVSFLGKKSQSYIFCHLKDYNILLQPSTAEGFGLSVAEAMAAKISVIVSNTDGLTEVVGDGKYGHIFKSNSSDELASTIKRIICNPDSEQRLNKAYDFAYNNFNIIATAQAYLNLYNNYEDTTDK